MNDTSNEDQTELTDELPGGIELDLFRWFCNYCGAKFGLKASNTVIVPKYKGRVWCPDCDFPAGKVAQ